MSGNMLSFIETEKSFKYSANIRFDIGDFDKLNSFVPTSKNIKLFERIFESFKINSASRAHVLVGAYGTGKSLFGTVLGTLLAYKDTPEKFDKFITKIKRYNPKLADKITNEINNKDPYLLVIPSTDHSNFKQSMLLALQQSLKKADMQDIFPNTYFRSIKNKLRQWEKEYPETYKAFKEKLKNQAGKSIEEFERALDNYDQNTYNLFVQLYSELTSGGLFNPHYGCSLNEIYLEVNREIRKKGYQGIYIIFDEFNKLMENNIETFDGEQLQEFAEMTSRTEEDEIHLLLISHKKLQQYASNLPKNEIDEWKKIEGRFTILEASQYSSQIYELMSNVIIKEEEKWQEHIKKNNEKFEHYKELIGRFDFCPDYNGQEKEKYILYGCYPLHPVTTVLLPKLAQKIAQNERTIFTFLSTSEKNTLGDFVNNYDENNFPIIRPSKIYDYFEELMQQEFEFTQVHEAWADSQRALQKIKDDDTDKREFIKTLGVIYAVNNFSELPPSKGILKFVLDYLEEVEFENLVSELIEDKIILYRKSLGHLKFFEGSEIDFNKKIKEKIAERENDFSGKYLLDDYFKPSPIYPKKYNDRYKITRYFVCDFLYLEEIEGVRNWKEYLVKYNNKSYIDGLVAYLLVKNEKEKKRAEEIVKNIDNKRIIFVLPKNPIDIDNLLKELDAQLLLLEDKVLLNKDSLAEKELFAYIEETKQQINNKLNKFVEPGYQSALYYHKGEREFQIRTRRDLSKKVSEICLEEFKKTPVINNELLVKNKITSPQRSARKEIVKTLLFDELNERLNITGYGPEFLIYRTFFVKPNLLLKDKDGNMIFNIDLEKGQQTKSNKPIDANLYEVINIIYDKLYSSKKPSKFGEVYDELRRPPFGLRLGVFPILLAIAGRLDKRINQVTIRHNGEEKEIDEDLFEEINRYPDRYVIETDNLDPLTERYLLHLEKLYEKYIYLNNHNEVNRLKLLFKGIKKWFQSLPKYTRETKDLSKDSIILRKLVNSRTTEVKRLILEVIPKKILGKEIETEEDLRHLKNVFTKFFKEENQALNQMKTKLQLEITNLFSNGNLSFTESLINWYDSLPDKARENTYTREINSFLIIIKKTKITDIKGEDLLEQLAINLTGFELNDWTDNTFEDFIKKLKEIKNTVEGFQEEEIVNSENSYEFILVDNKGNKYKRRFEKTKLEGLAGVLNKKIRNSFKDIGEAVSDKEKQQILVNLLKDMFNEDGVV